MLKLVGCAALLVALATAAAAGSSSGRIVYASDRGDGGTSIFTMNDHGSRVRRLTHPAPPGFDLAYSRDGRQVAFSRPLLENAAELWTANADGTSPRRLRRVRAQIGTTEGEDLQVAWTPDGRVAFVAFGGSKSEVWTIGRDGSRARLLLRDASSPAWSPDGTQLAFVRGYWMYVADAQGRHERRITTGDEPTWSPDGSQIAFVRLVGTNLHIYVIDVGDKQLRSLTRVRSRDERDPAWSADGRWIAYSACCDGAFRDVNGLYAVHPDGIGRHRLASNLVFPLAHPAWSPRGRLVFDRGVDLHSVGRAGGAQRPFFPGARGDNRAPVWLAGRRIAYTRDDGLHVMNADGSRDRVVSRLGSGSWSPDGRHVALENGADGIDVLDVTTGKQKEILSDQGAGDTTKSQPSWSPDGATIAYVDGEPDRGALTLYDVATGTSKSLGVETEGQIAWAPGAQRLAHVIRGRIVLVDLSTRTPRVLVRGREPSWSADGSRIAFVRGTGPAAEIYTIRADGSDLQRLTHNHLADTSPDW